MRKWMIGAALVAAAGAAVVSVMKTLSVQATVNGTQVVIADPAVGQAVPATSVAMSEWLGPRHAAGRTNPTPMSGASAAGLSSTAEFERPRY